MNYKDEYLKWLSSGALSAGEIEELRGLDENEIQDRFYTGLQFGTAGLRGVMGMGTNRMNVYTVRQTTQALATLICDASEQSRGVVVAMDCRINSELYAREAACCLAANGIKVFLFDELRPTPELSFAIRAIGCIAGINITASHNTKEYNGYKVYWQDGAQLPPDHASAVAEKMAATDIFTGARTMDYKKALSKGLITIIGEEVDEGFLFESLSMAIDRELIQEVSEDFKVVYTPFHGAGYRLVPEVLRRAGLKHIICVPEQMVTDGSFPTVKSPNPENPEGFKLAIELAKKEKSDIIIGTDPDADRVGIVVRNGDSYVPLTGNQVGVLLLDYIIGARASEKPACAIKTIVTTEMARAVAEQNGVAMFDTFTGFKFIAEKLAEIDDKYEYLIGFEESYGYMIGTFCRDKDAVTTSLLIAEMAAYYFKKGMTLYQAMESAYERYGRYCEKTINLVMPGVDGLEDMRRLMERLRENPPTEIAGERVARVRDYLTGKCSDGSDTEISGSNVLYFELCDDTRFIIRPSGTEPKIKIYILTHSPEQVKKYNDAANALI